MANSVAPRAAFEQEFRARQLVETFDRYIVGRSIVGRDGETVAAFRSHMRERVALIRRKVYRGDYRFSAYRAHLVTKGAASKPRVLSIPTVRDRLVLKALSRALQRVFPDAKPPLPAAVMQRLLDELEVGRLDGYVRLDVKEFFPSIRHQVVEHRLRERVRSKLVVDLVLKAIRTPTLGAARAAAPSYPCVGIPQGLSISNTLAEIAMIGIEDRIRALPGTAYFRYVDDILILCDHHHRERVAQVAQEVLEGEGLRIHPLGGNSKSTTGHVAESFDYLGYRLIWPRVSVRDTSVIKLKRSLTRVLTAHRAYIELWGFDAARVARARTRCELRLNMKITGCFFEGTRRGWLAYFSQVRHQQLLRHLDWYVQSELERFGLTGQVTPKTFVVAYRHLAKGKLDGSGYVPNFDAMTPHELRDALAGYFMMDRSFARSKSDVEVAEIFRRRMHNLVVELERDALPGYR